MKKNFFLMKLESIFFLGERGLRLFVEFSFFWFLMIELVFCVVLYFNVRYFGGYRILLILLCIFFCLF